MSNLKKYGLKPTSVLHLLDGNDDPMFADDADGKPDLNRPMKVRLFGPGTKQYAAAQAAQSNRNMERFKKKGKSDMTAEERVAETAKFLARCTDGFENIEVDGLSGKDLFMSVYQDIELCFIPAQIEKFINDTANFTPTSDPT